MLTLSRTRFAGGLDTSECSSVYYLVSVHASSFIFPGNRGCGIVVDPSAMIQAQGPSSDS